MEKGRGGSDPLFPTHRVLGSALCPQVQWVSFDRQPRPSSANLCERFAFPVCIFLTSTTRSSIGNPPAQHSAGTSACSVSSSSNKNSKSRHRQQQRQRRHGPNELPGSCTESKAPPIIGSSLSSCRPLCHQSTRDLLASLPFSTWKRTCSQNSWACLRLACRTCTPDS